MPITKTISIRTETNLKRALKYIINPEKTRGQELVSTHLLSGAHSAWFEMLRTRSIGKKLVQDKSPNQKGETIARHIIQSFSPEDNLTAEEVQEIGRQTVMELTGGNHEFVIATHIDKGHLHNHIIFNATSSTDLKKFRWHKRTAGTLRNISDKIADYHGALILDQPMLNSHTKFLEYRKQNQYRYEIKNRLNFLKRNAISWEDFLQKAKLLNLEIEESKTDSKNYGRVLKFKTTDIKQQRAIRDYTLNKKNRIYSYDEIKKFVEKNKKETVFALSEIITEYEKEKKEIESEPELAIDLSAFQIDYLTDRGLYVRINYGHGEQGTVKIQDYRLDETEFGGYRAYFKKTDTFQFLSEDNPNNNKLIRGGDLAYALSNDSGYVPRKVNSANQRIRNMTTALNLISIQKKKGIDAVELLGDNFISDYDAVKKSITTLDDKLKEIEKKLRFEPMNVQLVDKRAALVEEKEELVNELKAVNQELKSYQQARQYLKEKIEKNKQTEMFEKEQPTEKTNFEI